MMKGMVMSKIKKTDYAHQCVEVSFLIILYFMCIKKKVPCKT